jgi:hypothetical protein
MGHNEILIEKVFEMFKKRELSYRIDNSLKAHNLTLEEIDYIKDEASKKYNEYVVESIKKRNKICFYVGIGLSLLFLILFFFYLPTKSIVDNVTLLSVFGAVSLSFSIYFIYVFYKGWYPENIAEKPSIDFDLGNFFSFFALLGLIPSFIFFFIIQYRIENGAKKTLIETKVETVGVITSGAFYESRSLKGRRSNDAEITVKFVTKDKDKRTIKRTIDIMPNEFNNYYKGQKVNLIYSSVNPYNFMLLNSDEEVRAIFRTEEREIVFDDLTAFLEKNQKQISEKLNTISYGWNYDSNKNSWINSSRESVIMKKDSDILFFPRKGMDMFLDNYLRKNQYKKVSEDIPGIIDCYEKSNFRVEKMSLRQGTEILFFYRIYKVN